MPLFRLSTLSIEGLPGCLLVRIVARAICCVHKSRWVLGWSMEAHWLESESSKVVFTYKWVTVYIKVYQLFLIRSKVLLKVIKSHPSVMLLTFLGHIVHTILVVRITPIRHISVIKFYNLNCTNSHTTTYSL